MGKTIEIKSAKFGKLGRRDVDIRAYLRQHRYRIPKTLDLKETFGDPYPNTRKFVDVEIHIKEERTEMFHEEGFRIKNGGGRIGFETPIPFEIHIPNMYDYRVLKGRFDIIQMVIRPAEYGIQDETRIVDVSQYDRFVRRTDEGYFQVEERIDIVDWMGEDPFPFRAKVIELTYRREATYHVRVYEQGGFLLKDFVPLAELPLYRFHLLYHMYPKLDHHVMPVHRRYLSMFEPLTSQITVAVASDHEDDEELNEMMVREFLHHPRHLEILHVGSDPVLKDSASFYHLLDRASHVHTNFVLYAHAKGVTEFQMRILPNVASWIELSYMYLLSNLDVVVEQDANFAGCFMQTSKCDDSIVSWFYPGNFYWVKTRIVKDFARRNPPHERMIQPLQDIPKHFPRMSCPDTKGCVDLLPCKPHMMDLYNRQFILLQYKELIEHCAVDPLSRQVVGLL